MSSVKNYVNLINKYDRVVVLVDMDCFYCQVEEKLNPELKGKPIAVVQYNDWKGGGIIAVNYPARAKGVTRHMRGDEAKEHCPDIELCRVPCVRGKADLTKYRDAGKEVAAVLQSFTPLLERASIDEAYLDITETVTTKLKDMNDGKYKLDASKFSSTFAVGYNNMGEFVHDITNRCGSSQETDDYSQSFENESEHEKNSRKRSEIKLLIGAAVVNDIRAAVKEKTGFECSAGIAHNKILAKLTAGMNKPNKQTVLPLRSIPEMYATLPISKVKGLGGKFGEQVCEFFKIKFMAQLVSVPKEELLRKFDEKNGNWLYLMSRGVDLECVTPRYTSKSIGCCKRFPGKSAITGLASLNHWILELATEICERLEKDVLENNRTAKQMTISYTQAFGTEDVSSSRSVPLNYYEPEPIAKEALEVIKRNTAQFFKPDNLGVLNNLIKFLGISVGKFENNVDTNKKTAIQEMFENKLKKVNPAANDSDREDATMDFKETLESEEASTKTTLDEIMAKKKHETTFSFQKEKTKPNKATLEQMFKNHAKNTAKPIEPELPETEKSEKQNEVEEKSKPKSLLREFLENKRRDRSSVDEEKMFEKSPEKSPRDSTVAELEAEICDSNKWEPVASTSRAGIEQESIAAPNQSEVEQDFLLPEEQDFVLPEIEVPLIQCTMCKRKIPEDEMPAHHDYHFALQLSQQQREEFRNEMKSKFSSPQNIPPQSSKAKSGKSKTENVRPIQVFLKKLNRSTEEEDSEEEKIKCEECEKMIKISCVHEHSDYHLAKKLHQEMNQMETNRSKMSSKKSSSVATQNSNKRKRTASANEKTNPVKLKPLTTFFEKID